MPSALVPALLSAAVIATAGAATAATCESLSSVSLPNVTVTLAQPVAAGAFTPPARGGNAGRGPQFGDLPAFCRVQATLRPTSDSDIKMELWLPASADGSGEAGRTTWNGKFRGTGNGGLGGGAGVNAGQLAAGVRKGYASATGPRTK
jgi:feruloyl esterase